MLEPREADIPVLFLFLVVLPLVTYIILGKWNDAAKKKARISMLAQLAAEEARSVEATSAVDVVPVGSLSNIGSHLCARCFGPATTRCSRCKSVRYCSGKCQIIHWRQGHKQECQQWETDSSNISASSTSVAEATHQMGTVDAYVKSTFPQNNEKESMHNTVTSNMSSESTGNTYHVSAVERNSLIKRDSHKFRSEFPKLEEDASFCLKEISGCGTASQYASTAFCEPPSNEASRRQKSGNGSSVASENISINRNNTYQTPSHSSSDSRNVTHEAQHLKVQDRSGFESPPGSTSSVHSERVVANGCRNEIEFSSDKLNFSGHEFSSANWTLGLSSSAEKIPVKGGTKFRKPPYTIESNPLSQKLAPRSREHLLSGTEKKSSKEKESHVHQVIAPPAIPAQNANGVSNMEVDKKMPSTKILPNAPKLSASGISSDTLKKNKVLFPYEDLVKFFQCELCDISPRGLLNCGNSCYANVVLQCLTCTKPLLVYLLRGMHSRTCITRDWCLLCELELHVLMLREGGAPLSPSRILSNMRNIGCRMGGGNQEDAHEFLRLLVMSMQSICLEGLGGEKEVDSRLQETTLIQQIFGGRLKSKVKCLKCDLESERYENIMDLTLEIHGWVESLEDALTQFTAPEDLDGDNMYRCGRCYAYVRARKQLSVHEAPNILTIVLKRFQSGKYGKINKCVTFPEMLDMIPYMTGTSDSPPLYMLYAVVVHLDTLNASFSGHYVSYVKDLQGTWFRIDDTEVQAVPLSQVMSEGAYMLFYSRSFPRPPRIYSGKATTQVPSAAKHSMSKPPKSSRHGSSKPSGILLQSDTPANLGTELRSETSAGINGQATDCISKNASRYVLPSKGNLSGSASMDFSDAASSDWSLFTSSDESSFTTESTSDSFSTVDYSDAASLDPITSLFSPVYIPEYSRKSTISCRKFTHCRAQTRFFPESKGFVLDSSTLTHPCSCVHRGKNQETDASRLQRYGSNPKGSCA